MSNSTTAYTEQPAANGATDQHDPSPGFFAIGIAINLILITAYFIWAYKQWKKNDRHKE